MAVARVLAVFIFSWMWMHDVRAQVYQPTIASHFAQLDGRPFLPIDMEDVHGDTLNTASLKGKTLYVDFWFTQCAPCLHEIPYLDSLQQYFSADTNVVFLSICIENIDRKDAWKKMVAEKKPGGIQLFYARNRPQKINLLRQYRIYNFPWYLLVDEQQNIVGYDAPRPSEKGWVHWALTQAAAHVKLTDAYRQVFTPAYTKFIHATEERTRKVAADR